MILSKINIEDLAEEVLNDFRCATNIYTVFTPIDQLCSDYLGLEVVFAKLSDDLSLCGVTAYDDTKLKVVVEGKSKILELKKNHIVLDSEFINPMKIRDLCGKRRFTLAHEVAHHILFEMESDENKAKHRNLYSTRKAHTIRQLKTAEDWNEWQADYLGAALLMPRDGVSMFMRGINCRDTSFDRGSNEDVEYILNSFCHIFHVSRSAAIIRLKNLGYFADAKGTGVAYA